MTEPKSDGRRTRMKRVTGVNRALVASVRMPEWLLTWLDAQPQSRSKTVVDALQKTHKLKSPKENES